MNRLMLVFAFLLAACSTGPTNIADAGKPGCYFTAMSSGGSNQGRQHIDESHKYYRAGTYQQVICKDGKLVPYNP